MVCGFVIRTVEGGWSSYGTCVGKYLGTHASWCVCVEGFSFSRSWEQGRGGGFGRGVLEKRGGWGTGTPVCCCATMRDLMQMCVIAGVFAWLGTPYITAGGGIRGMDFVEMNELFRWRFVVDDLEIFWDFVVLCTVSLLLLIR